MHPTQRAFDVLIVGAGLSGIAAARYLQTRCPGKSWAILEAREALGGTWDLFKYPGIRSDSDMHTLGFSFRPWTDPKAIADGPAILRYLQETAEETGIDRRIRFGHRVVRATWSSADARWTVTVERDGGEEETLTCGFLWACTGYYRYDEGYTPDFPGVERFEGEIVHPQKWSDATDATGKRVVVIGSGATAMTLIPSLTDRAEHVTMLQRSPTYVFSLPRVDRVASWLRRRLPERTAYALTRWKNILRGIFYYELAQRRPKLVRRRITDAVRAAVGDTVDVDTHFNPRYDPWDERVCVVPDGDLFEALRAGRASIVTDRIAAFTPRGIALESGRELEADMIVTATGLQLQFLGGATLEVDGEPVEPSERLMYKGSMLDGVPNAAISLGYTNASWTLKCELTSEYVCRLLNHMDARGATICCPRRGPSVRPRPLIPLRSGYIARAASRLPKQGQRLPWRLYQNYVLDRFLFRRTPIEDGVLELTRAPRAARTEAEMRATA